MVIAGSVNNYFKPLENLRTGCWNEMIPRAEKAGVYDLLAIDGWSVIEWLVKRREVIAIKSRERKIES